MKSHRWSIPVPTPWSSPNPFPAFQRARSAIIDVITTCRSACCRPVAAMLLHQGRAAPGLRCSRPSQAGPVCLPAASRPRWSSRVAPTAPTQQGGPICSQTTYFIPKALDANFNSIDFEQLMPDSVEECPHGEKCWGVATKACRAVATVHEHHPPLMLIPCRVLPCGWGCTMQAALKVSMWADSTASCIEALAATWAAATCVSSMQRSMMCCLKVLKAKTSTCAMCLQASCAVRKLC